MKLLKVAPNDMILDTSWKRTQNSIPAYSLYLVWTLMANLLANEAKIMSNCLLLSEF